MNLVDSFNVVFPFHFNLDDLGIITRKFIDKQQTNFKDIFHGWRQQTERVIKEKNFTFLYLSIENNQKLEETSSFTSACKKILEGISEYEFFDNYSKEYSKVKQQSKQKAKAFKNQI